MLSYIKTFKPDHINSTVDFRYFLEVFSKIHKFSLVEQSMAFRSDVLIGMPQSEWSKMISIDRQQANYAAEECSIMEYMINAKCVSIMQEMVRISIYESFYMSHLKWLISTL